MTTFTVPWTDHNCVPQHTDNTQIDRTPNPSLPNVLLLHGIGGDISHMSDPGPSPGMNFDLDFVPPLTIDRCWHGYPQRRPMGYHDQPTQPVRSLQSAIAQSGFLTFELCTTGA
jgi:hypothetical protein